MVHKGLEGAAPQPRLSQSHNGQRLASPLSHHEGWLYGGFLAQVGGSSGGVGGWEVGVGGEQGRGAYRAKMTEA